ncbi:MAG: orotidine-5'-phosphate decarboxylase [Candidatus Thermoplasmatota archaeon]|nr:orotidine-5'-phosphate decarboxylase [Candidatus Thermoplasmatota archaeon]
MKKRTRLILALDVTDRQEAMRVVSEVADHVDAVKVGYPAVLPLGMELVEEISGSADVICDFKVADIPNTNRLIVEEVFRRGASGVIVHGFMGTDSVRACVDAADGDVFVLAEASHPGGKEFTQPVADRLARLAVEAGASGIIAPATRPERVKELREIVGSLLILCPGVGTQGGSASDTIAAGADYVIVGRSIYQAENPRAIAEGLVEEIAAVV